MAFREALECCQLVKYGANAEVCSAGLGVVEKNGPGASKFHPGQRVVSAAWGAATGNGTWQQYLAVPEQVLVSLIAPARFLGDIESVRHDVQFLLLLQIPVPDSVPDEAAAQYLVNPLTSYGFLDILQVSSLLCLAYVSNYSSQPETRLTGEV